MFRCRLSTACDTTMRERRISISEVAAVLTSNIDDMSPNMFLEELGLSSTWIIMFA